MDGRSDGSAESRVGSNNGICVNIHSIYCCSLHICCCWRWRHHVIARSMKNSSNDKAKSKYSTTRHFNSLQHTPSRSQNTQQSQTQNRQHGKITWWKLHKDVSIYNKKNNHKWELAGKMMKSGNKYRNDYRQKCLNGKLHLLGSCCCSFAPHDNKLRTQKQNTAQDWGKHKPTIREIFLPHSYIPIVQFLEFMDIHQLFMLYSLTAFILNVDKVISD